jgi:hypothetical protein
LPWESSQDSRSHPSGIQSRTENWYGDVPLFLVTTILSMVMGFVLLLQIPAQRDIYLINKSPFGFGHDYDGFYTASVLVREGRTPYSLYRYVTPPTAAILNVPLTCLPYNTAYLLIAVLTLLSVLASLYLCRRIFKPPGAENGAMFFASVMIIICFSYPFYFLLDRGNIDGFVLLLVSLGLYSLVARHDRLAGVAFALAISLKVYPVLVVVPLLAFRRRRPLVWMAIILVSLFLLMPGLWMEFFRERIFARGSQWRTDENGSITSTFFFIGGLLGCSAPFVGASQLVYAVLLGTLSYLDFKTRGDDKQLCTNIVMYLPFMVAVPWLSYHYELVVNLAMIPMISWLWAHATARRQQLLLVLIACGIALSQFQAVAVGKLTGSVVAHFVPGFGLLIVMVATVAYRLREFLSMRQQLALRSLGASLADADLPAQGNNEASGG